MPLVGLAVVGRDGDLMYVRQFRRNGPQEEEDDFDFFDCDDDCSDPFGKIDMEEPPRGIDREDEEAANQSSDPSPPATDGDGAGGGIDDAASSAPPTALLRRSQQTRPPKPPISTTIGRSDDCSLRHQFVLLSALDRFDEIVGPDGRAGRRNPASVSGSEAMWVGLLCPVEELRVYGYLTATGVRILASVVDSFPPDEAADQRRREAELRETVAGVHGLYVERSLNPFAAVGTGTRGGTSGRIVSRRFDDGVERFVGLYNGGAGGGGMA